MRNVELNEDAINELLNMPNMRVKRIHCNRVSAMASLTKLGSKPVTLFIDRCEVDLEEPAEFVAPTAILEELMQKLKAKEGAKKKMYGFGDRIGDGIRVEIGSLRISVGMQGAHKTAEIGQWTPPTLRINVRNVIVASTTSSWKEADLDTIWQQENKGKPEIRVCKRVVCEAVSLSLLPSAWKTAAAGAQPVVLFTDLPVRKRADLVLCAAATRLLTRALSATGGCEFDRSQNCPRWCRTEPGGPHPDQQSRAQTSA